MLGLLPAELRPFVIFMDFHEAISSYEALRKGTIGNDLLGPGRWHCWAADSVMAATAAGPVRRASAGVPADPAVHAPVQQVPVGLGDRV